MIHVLFILSPLKKVAIVCFFVEAAWDRPADISNNGDAVLNSSQGATAGVSSALTPALLLLLTVP
jgi:hypothetical protein